MERAWRLPVAATFDRRLAWQSNASRCGPAALANAYRSLGDAAVTEAQVLAGTGRCWTGVCILGLTLDELADGCLTVDAESSDPDVESLDLELGGGEDLAQVADGLRNLVGTFKL